MERTGTVSRLIIRRRAKVHIILINNKSSAVAEMGDRGHNRHQPKSGGAVPFFRESWVPM